MLGDPDPWGGDPPGGSRTAGSVTQPIFVFFYTNENNKEKIKFSSIVIKYSALLRRVEIKII